MAHTKNSNNKVSSSIVIATQKADKVAEYQALLDGFAGPDLAGVDPLTIEGVSWVKADLVAKFKSRLDAAKGTAAAHANLAVVVATEHTVATEVDPLRLHFKSYLKTRLGRTSPKLQNFGFAPEKPRTQSAASKAASAAKGTATRKAKKTAVQAVAQGAANASSEPAAASPAPAPASPAVAAKGTSGPTA